MAVNIMAVVRNKIHSYNQGIVSNTQPYKQDIGLTVEGNTQPYMVDIAMVI